MKRSLFLDDRGKFSSYEDLLGDLKEKNIIENWPTKDVYYAYKALSEVDSITIDPHKLGYIPYPCGAIIFKEDSFKDLIACFAPYVFREMGDPEKPELIGMYIMEGSKPGASASAAYLAHKVVPLNRSGYGVFIGESIEGANRLYDAIQKSVINVEINEKKHQIKGMAIGKPDLNILSYAFNFDTNSSLKSMNDFNLYIKDHFKYISGQVIHKSDFILSSTDLNYGIYGDTPLPFLESLGIQSQDYINGTDIFVLRSCILTPYLTTDYIDEDYLQRFINKLSQVIESYFKK